MDLKVEIQGHTDSFGVEIYNKDLSERRALSVKKYLTKNGVDEKRLTTVGFGETSPVATNKTAEGRAKNRRIEFKEIK
jgi:outer membrane protein OmpA-like peptidoglycan-associated protein